MVDKGDTIYRQDVLKLIQTIPPEEPSRQLLHQSVLQMSSAETEPNSWTPCSKKKHPDRTTDCYVTIRDKYCDFVDEDTWWEESECWDKYKESEIIAWMPNIEPEPYNSLSMLRAENRGEK